MVNSLKKLQIKSVADSEYARGANLLLLASFSQKLHKNGKNGPRGRVLSPCRLSPGSANVNCTQKFHRVIKLLK